MVIVSFIIAHGFALENTGERIYAKEVKQVRFQIHGRQYRIGHKIRFSAFVLMLILLCTLTGYGVSSAAAGNLRQRVGQEAYEPVRSLNWLATELTGNR